MAPSPVRLADFSTAQAEIEALHAELTSEHSPTTAIELIPKLLAHPCIEHSAVNPRELAGDLAHSLADLERYEEAIEAWEEAIAAGYSSAPHPRAYVAESLMLSGRVEEGTALFEELVLQCSDDPWLRSVAGISCVLIDDDEAALRWFEEGIEVSIVQGDSNRILAQLVELTAGARDRLGADANNELAQRIESMEIAPAGAGHHWNETDPPPAAPPEGCPVCGYQVGCDAPDGLDPDGDPSNIAWGEVDTADEPMSLPPGDEENDPFGLVDILFGSGQGLGPDAGEGSGPASETTGEAQAATGAVVKIGRNQPCRCGSGRKSKHCCG